MIPILVNKNQLLDDWEKNYYQQIHYAGFSGISASWHENIDNFEREEVTEEQLLEYINLGYGIKIHCK